MGIATTTITAKRQVTIPKELDKEFPVQPGTRLSWTVENGALVARRVRSISELAGSLKPTTPYPGAEAEKRAVEKARSKHYAKRYAKP